MPKAQHALKVLAPHAAGYEADTLDPAIQNAIRVLEEGSGLISDILPEARLLWAELRADFEAARAAEPDASLSSRMTRQLLKKDLASLVIMVEKLGKLLNNTAKVTDEITRLRSFLGGGPDRRIENLDGLSELEMEEAVLRAAERIRAKQRNVATLAIGGQT